MHQSIDERLEEHVLHIVQFDHVSNSIVVELKNNLTDEPESNRWRGNASFVIRDFEQLFPIEQKRAVEQVETFCFRHRDVSEWNWTFQNQE